MGDCSPFLSLPGAQCRFLPMPFWLKHDKPHHKWLTRSLEWPQSRLIMMYPSRSWARDSEDCCGRGNTIWPLLTSEGWGRGEKGQVTVGEGPGRFAVVSLPALAHCTSVYSSTDSTKCFSSPQSFPSAAFLPFRSPVFVVCAFTSSPLPPFTFCSGHFFSTLSFMHRLTLNIENQKPIVYAIPF